MRRADPSAKMRNSIHRLQASYRNFWQRGTTLPDAGASRNAGTARSPPRFRVGRNDFPWRDLLKAETALSWGADTPKIPSITPILRAEEQWQGGWPLPAMCVGTLPQSHLPAVRLVGQSALFRLARKYFRYGLFRRYRLRDLAPARGRCEWPGEAGRWFRSLAYSLY